MTPPLHGTFHNITPPHKERVAPFPLDIMSKTNPTSIQFLCLTSPRHLIASDHLGIIWHLRLQLDWWNPCPPHQARILSMIAHYMLMLLHSAPLWPIGLRAFWEQEPSLCGTFHKGLRGYIIDKVLNKRGVVNRPNRLGIINQGRESHITLWRHKRGL